MKEHPILFSGEMVRAILEGRKTQTRRPMAPQPPEGHWWAETEAEQRLAAEYYPSTHGRGCPYGIPGDHLWVRETFILEETDEVPTDGRPYREMEEPGEFGQLLVPHYRATESEPHIVPLDLSDSYDDRTRWHPSIHMPKWASRITLEVTGVRVERVQDINDADAVAEGVLRDALGWWGVGEMFLSGEHANPVDAFSALWDSVYTKRGYGWDANPWVWVVEFKKGA